MTQFAEDYQAAEAIFPVQALAIASTDAVERKQQDCSAEEQESGGLDRKNGPIDEWRANSGE